MRDEHKSSLWPRRAQLGSLGIFSLFWLLPITAGGIHEIVSFLAWALAIISVLVVSASLAVGPKCSKPPANMWKWPMFFVKWGAVFWMVYHGLNVLPALLTYSLLFVNFVEWQKKQECQVNG